MTLSRNVGAALRVVCVALVVLLCGGAWAGEAALVMSVQGRVTRLGESAPLPVEAFVKLKDGERIELAGDSRLQLVYFDGGRQERWTGPGRFEVMVREGKALDLKAAEAKRLPEAIARQLARTPAPDGSSAAVRTRALPTPDAMAKLDQTYRSLRQQADSDDLGPEMYLLAGLLEMRELDRVDAVLADLQQGRPKNPEAALLVALYRKAVRNVRESRK